MVQLLYTGIAWLGGRKVESHYSVCTAPRYLHKDRMVIDLVRIGDPRYRLRRC